MPQVIDQLYVDLSLRAHKFHADVAKAETDLARLGSQLSKEVPNAATVAAASMRQSATAATESATKAKGAFQLETEAILATRNAAKLSSVEMEKHIATLAKGAEFAGTRAASVAALTALEQKLTYALGAENLALETQIALQANLARTQTALTAAQTGAAAAVTGLTSLVTGGLSTALSLAATALVTYFLTARKEIADANAAIERLISQAKARKDSPLSVTALELRKVKAEAQQAEAALSKLVAQTQRSNTASGQAGGLTTGLTDEARERAFREAVDAVNLARAKQIGLERELAAQRAGAFQANEAKLEQEASQLGEVLRSGKATEAQLARITALRRVYSEVAEKSAGTDVKSLEAQTRALGILASLEDRRAKTKTGEAEANFAGPSRDVLQRFDDLEARAKAGTVSLGDFTRASREIDDAYIDLTKRFEKVKKPTDEQRAAIAALTAGYTAHKKTLADVEATLTALHTRTVTRDFEALRASLTKTVVDDFRVSLAGLHEELAKKEYTEEQIEQIRAIKTALAEAAISGEAFDGELARIQKTAISSFDAQLGLQALLAKTTEELRQFTESDAGQTADEAARITIASLEAQIAKLKALIKSLGGDAAGYVDKSATGAQKFASALQDAASLAFGIATAFLGADHTITKMIGGVSQIAAGFNQIATLAGSGGIGKLFSTGAGLASALPALGGIIGGAASIGSLLGVGKGDPEARAYRAETAKQHTENLATLRQIRDGVFDLASVSLTGGERGRGRDALTTQLSLDGGDPSALGGIKSTEELDKVFRALGTSIDEVRKVASQYGVELNRGVASYTDLLDILRADTLRKFNEGLAGSLRLLDAQEATGAIKGADALVKRVGILTGKDGFPALGAALGGLTEGLDTAGGRTAAIAQLQELLANFGSLDQISLGGLSPSDAFNSIVDLIKRLQELTPPAKTASEKFADAIEFAALRVEFGLDDAAENLSAAIDAFRANFGDIATSIDFSSADSFRESIKALIDTFDDDGVLTDAEKAQADALRVLLAAYEKVTPAIEKNANAVESLGSKFRVGDQTAEEQLDDTLEARRKQSRPRFDPKGGGADAAGGLLPADPVSKAVTDFFAGFNLKTEEGIKAARAAARKLYDEYNVDGISEEEQKILDGIGDIFDLADRFFAEVAAKAQAAEEKRKHDIDRDADARRRVDDVTDPVEDLGISVDSLGKKFPALVDTFKQWDLTTQEGRDAMEAWIASTVKSPAALQALADSLGISVDELLTYLLGLDDGLDRATQHVKTFGEQFDETFKDLDFDLDVKGITDPVERLVAHGKEFAKLIPGLIDGFDLTTAAGRKAADAALQKWLLDPKRTDEEKRAGKQVLDESRSIKPSTEPPATGGDLTGRQQSQIDQAIQSIAVSQLAVNPQFDRMITLEERQAVSLEAILATLTAGVSPIAPPAMPATWGAGGGGYASNGGNSTTAGGVQIVFETRIEQNFPNVTGKLDDLRNAVNDGVSDAMVTTIDQKLGKNSTVSNLLQGNLTRGPLN